MDALGVITRIVRTTKLNHQEATLVLVQQEFSAPVSDVWSACTDPQRLGQWFLPVTGGTKAGDNYALEGNASGEILECNAPRNFRISWVFGGGPYSEVEVRLIPTTTDRTLVELEHTTVVDPAMMATFGPGAAGVGWDLTLFGLGRHLRGIPTGPASPHPPEVLNPFVAGSSDAWADAAIAMGAEPRLARDSAVRTTAFYTGAADAGTS
ncbi:SRPBCC domain-containing protein [Specibacter sp. RAF43]|uniref:SRPBCC domain-containing protein n=1 Tax=Specibacter sp. RAF43 TaxID=3233057 RepID=UPI003F9E2E2E